jgi:hypothetical protein
VTLPTLNEAQLQAFAAARRAQLELEGVGMLRRTYAEATASRSDEQLLEFIRAGIERAGRYGLTRDDVQVRWLHLMVQLGPCFDEDERYAVQAAPLRDGKLDQGAKLAMLELAAMAERDKHG